MRAIVFDFDGVLVDSEPLHERALHDCLAPEGIEIGTEEYRSVYLAYSDADAIRLALARAGDEAGPERIARLCERKARLFDSLRGQVPVFSGARELVERLAVPLAIASGALRAEIEALLASAGLRERFRLVVAADDVSRGKPDPEPYARAVRLLGRHVPDLVPGECVAIEDSPAGIASARAAGLRVAAVTHSFPARDLQQADLVVGSLSELDAGTLESLCPTPGERMAARGPA